MEFGKSVLKPGNGGIIKSGDFVRVHITGYGKNGDLQDKFWSTRDPGKQPVEFTIGKGKVLKGWNEGITGMQLEEKARFHCPPDYAYGTNAFLGWGIQANSTVEFEIEVLKVEFGVEE